MYSREYVAKQRREALKLLGGVCTRCGLSDVRVLQVDHVYSDGPVDRRLGYIGTKLYKRIAKFPTEYQLLCANCNWIKRYELGEVRNGRASK